MCALGQRHRHIFKDPLIMPCVVKFEDQRSTPFCCSPATNTSAPLAQHQPPLYLSPATKPSGYEAHCLIVSNFSWILSIQCATGPQCIPFGALSKLFHLLQNPLPSTLHILTQKTLTCCYLTYGFATPFFLPPSQGKVRFYFYPRLDPFLFLDPFSICFNYP